MGKIVNAIIQLRRDNDYNYERIKNTFIPADGEVVLVDTVSSGLRIKVGNGVSTYAQLPYADEDYRQNTLLGYYEDGVFYDNKFKNNVLPRDINKFYVDTVAGNAYYFNGSQFVNLQGIATGGSAGIMKLYGEKGQNTDGTITQKLFTDEINKKYEIALDPEDDETIIFKIT